MVLRDGQKWTGKLNLDSLKEDRSRHISNEVGNADQREAKRDSLNNELNVPIILTQPSASGPRRTSQFSRHSNEQKENLTESISEEPRRKSANPAEKKPLQLSLSASVSLVAELESWKGEERDGVPPTPELHSLNSPYYVAKLEADTDYFSLTPSSNGSPAQDGAEPKEKSTRGKRRRHSMFLRTGSRKPRNRLRFLSTSLPSKDGSRLSASR